MTIDEAKYVMKLMFCHDCRYAHSGDCSGNECKQAMNMAIEALDKQMPKKPTPDEQKLFYELCCPVCGNVVWKFVDNFCSHCGQALGDWSDNDDI